MLKLHCWSSLVTRRAAEGWLFQSEQPGHPCITPVLPCRPHLNFISGENGSGKSAALQCLQVCLGVQARLTGRAKTGKELINDSSAVATAKVILWNTVRTAACRSHPKQDL